MPGKRSRFKSIAELLPLFGDRLFLRRRFLYLAFTITSLALIFQNCGQGFQSQSTQSEAAAAPLNTPGSYSWVATNWGVCSKLCGGGDQTRAVSCVGSNGPIVNDRNCSLPKPGVSQTCNQQACANYMWIQGGFGPCSVTCGGGTQTQTVTCQNSQAQVVSNAFCIDSMPPTSRSCNSQSCPVPLISANVLAQKPYMGFNTYYASRMSRMQVNQTSLQQIADDMNANGLAAAGYNILSFDIGWWYSTTGSPRDPTTHQIIPSPLIPDLKGVVNHIHADGLLAGVYTDPGIGDAAGCGGFPGSGGYIDQDVRQFIGWGFDFLKLDHCGGNPHAAAAGINDPGNAAYAQWGYGTGSAYEYGLWANAILAAAQSTGKQLIFNIGDAEGISDHVHGWAHTIGNSWRTQMDIAVPPQYPVTWSTILRNFEGNDTPPVAGPGHWNDPDYLLIGGYGLSTIEEQSYFNMWVIQAAPLILATWPADLAPTAADGPRLRAMLLNPEVIAIDQDSLGRQGEKVREDSVGVVVYSKVLSGSGRRAVLLLNKNDSAVSSISFTWGDIGLANGSASIRDVVAKSNLGSFSNGYTSTGIPAHGSRLFLVTGTDSTPSLNNSWEKLGGKILGTPSVTSLNGTEVVFGLGVDHYFWMNQKTASGWSGWSQIRPANCSNDVTFFGDPAAIAVNGMIHLVGSGIENGAENASLQKNVFASHSNDGGKTWTCFTNLGGNVFGHLGNSSPDGSSIDVMGRGWDNAIWRTRWNSSNWSSWQSLGASIISGVQATSRGNGVVDVVAIGTDSHVWHGWYSGTSAITWDQIPSNVLFSNTPSVAWNSTDGTLHVYATSRDSQEVNSTFWNSTTGWQPWVALNGCSKAGASAVKTPIGFDVFGTGCNQNNLVSDQDPQADSVIRISN